MSSIFTTYTFQDWESWGKDPKKLQAIISAYKSTDEFKQALVAQEYFASDNVGIRSKVILEADCLKDKDANGRTTYKATNRRIEGNRIRNNFFRRFVMQENQHTLSNGVTLETTGMKEKLGIGFDKKMADAGENALIQGVCWGYWNLDHVEIIPSASDETSGFVALLDEMTGEPRLGVQFWQIGSGRPMYVRTFEEDGVTVYRSKKGKQLEVVNAKRGYKQTVSVDQLGERVISEENWSRLPLVPFYGNREKKSELSPSIRTKIDLYDRILSDFGDNLDKSNDIYWVINNFGGGMKEIAEMLHQMHELKAIANISDGTASSTVEPHAFEVPYNARSTALHLLEQALYKDYMALSTESITGGSLTTVAIKAAMMDLDMKANAFEWQAFQFVQGILAIQGIHTENIRFNRSSLTNDSETIQNIYMMRQDIDRKTALQLNPYILDEEIPGIMENLDAEEVSGSETMEQLQTRIDRIRAGEDVA